LSEPKRYEEMGREERLRAANKAAIVNWWEEQTRGKALTTKQKMDKIDTWKDTLEKIRSRLKKPKRR